MSILCDLGFLCCLTVMSPETGLSCVAFLPQCSRELMVAIVDLGLRLRSVCRDWSAEADWSLTLVNEDWGLVGNMLGATQLGFALLMTFVEIEGLRHDSAVLVQRQTYGRFQLDMSKRLDLDAVAAQHRGG